MYQRVREECEQAGLSRKELAAALAVSRDWVKERLTGRVTLAADDLGRIAHVLQVDPGIFFQPAAPAAALEATGSGCVGEEEAIDRLLLQILDRLITAWRDLPALELETLHGIVQRRHLRRERRGAVPIEDVIPMAEPARPAE